MLKFDIIMITVFIGNLFIIAGGLYLVGKAIFKK